MLMPLHTDEELKVIARDLYMGKIFCTRHIPENQVDTMIHTVFMPLVFLKPEQTQEFVDAKVNFLFEYLDKAGPRSCNGMPGFFSMRYLLPDEEKKMWEYFTQVKAAMDGVMGPSESKKNLLVQAGFTEEVQRLREHKCPTCSKDIDPSSFRDELSKKEFSISGMCQECQDLTFKDDPEETPEEYLQGENSDIKKANEGA